MTQIKLNQIRITLQTSRSLDLGSSQNLLDMRLRETVVVRPYRLPSVNINNFIKTAANCNYISLTFIIYRIRGVGQLQKHALITAATVIVA